MFPAMPKKQQKAPANEEPVEDVKALFAAQGWRFPTERLDDPAFIEGWRTTWKARLHYGHAPAAAIELPDSQDLFRLATDACFGPYPRLSALRFRTARLMASQDRRDKEGFVKTPKGTVYKPASLEQTITNVENAARPATQELVRSLAEGLAPVYHVNPAWLIGEQGMYGAVDQALVVATLAGEEREDRKKGSKKLLPWVPDWLVPWMRSIDVAVSACEVLTDDLFLSDKRYWIDMLERFIQHRRAMIEAEPTRWAALVYFPFAHAALVEARDHVMDGIPAWMMPDGDAGSVQMSIGQRSRRRAFLHASQQASKHVGLGKRP
jgi:hypothetical protein